PLFERWNRRRSPSRCRSPRLKPVRSFATRESPSCACARPIRSRPSGSGTKTSRRPVTRKCRSCFMKEIRRTLNRLTGADSDFDSLLELIGNARFVLVGEASHGTHEFYATRAAITRRLIAEKGFNAVAVEADWPDAYRLNRFVRGIGNDAEAVEALADFKRFPTWMWRNADVLDFIGCLREFNET